MKKNSLSAALLLLYSGFLVKVMILKDVPIIRSGQVTLDFGGTNGGHPANFIPFTTILPYLLGRNGLTIGFLNLGGNVALLIPIGFLISFIYPKVNWKQVLGIGMSAGLLIEGVQTLLKVGIFDIDDVILNSLGVLVGYIIFQFIKKCYLEKKYLPIVLMTLMGVASAAGAVYVMYPHGEQPANAEISNFSEAPKAEDLCKGTNGTGKIITLGENTITIEGRRKDVITNQTILLTDKTEMKNSKGNISSSDLKIGDRVTVVIDDSETASVVLVCGVAE